MLNIYRRIRRHLLEEGKLSRYLLYALGEITLVVIGILIALAINNWKEQKNLEVKEQVYLKGLLTEFETSKKKLQELIAVNEQNYESAKSILSFTRNRAAPPTEQEFAALLLNTFARDLAFNPNNSLLNEMLSSGSLKDLKSTELRKELTNWLATLEDIAKQEHDLAGQREAVFDIFRKGEYSIRTIFDQVGASSEEFGLAVAENEISNLGLLESLAFENNLLLFISTCKATGEVHYKPLLEDLNDILVLLQEEIDRHEK